MYVKTQNNNKKKKIYKLKRWLHQFTLAKEEKNDDVDLFVYLIYSNGGAVLELNAVERIINNT